MENGNLKFKIIFLAIIFFSVFGWAESSQAATISVVNASGQPSCEQIDVQAAINSASDKDTVLVPAGECTWTTKITFNKSLSIIGQGIGNTTIIGNTSSSWGNSPIWVNSTGGGLTIRISGFTFRSVSMPSEGMIAIAGPDNIVRVDHNLFYNMTGRSISLFGLRIKGVIDHNTFHTDASGTSNVQSIFIRGSANSQTSANTSWTIPLEFGTDKFIFVEDNTFTYDLISDGLMDCENGGRRIFRYNIINGTKGGTLGGHGYDSVVRGCMFSAIHDNNFSNTTSNSRAIQFRGGSGVVYGNTFTGTWTQNFSLTNYRSNNICSAPGGGGLCDQPVEKGDCDGTTASPAFSLPDGNISWGWPCRDQIGRVGGANDATDQISFPLYQWGNIKESSVTVNPIIYDGITGLAVVDPNIIEGRDYFNCINQADCVSKGMSYSEYAYPHPLRVSGPLADIPADTTPPAPPSGLIIM